MYMYGLIEELPTSTLTPNVTVTLRGVGINTDSFIMAVSVVNFVLVTVGAVVSIVEVSS